MSDTDTTSDGDDEPTAESLAARVRDLETEVYGYSNDEQSAGDELLTDVKRSIVFLENRHPEPECNGVRIERLYEVTDVLDIEQSLAEQAYEKLRRRGEVYEPRTGEVRTI